MNQRRALIWVPRGPVGVAVFFLLLALGIAAAVALSLALLAAAAVGVVALGVYGVGRTLAGGVRERIGDRDDAEVEVLVGPERPDEVYLRGVEEFDRLVTALLRVDPERHDGWRQTRSLHKAEDRIERLRAGLERAERTLAMGTGPQAIGPGLWELLIAARELERYLDALVGFPRSRALRQQLDELEALRQQAAALDRRRDALLLRLRHTDLRGHHAQDA